MNGGIVVRALPKIFTILVAVAGIVIAIHYVRLSSQLLSQFDANEVQRKEETEAAHADASAPAGAHGAPAEGGHAPASTTPAVDPTAETGGVPIVSLEELFVNVGTEDDAVHSVGVKLDLELFSESSRVVIETMQPGLKQIVIQAAREQQYVKLQSIAGKLYFKEQLVTRINEFMNQPIVRDIHFATFYLQ